MWTLDFAILKEVLNKVKTNLKLETVIGRPVIMFNLHIHDKLVGSSYVKTKPRLQTMGFSR